MGWAIEVVARLDRWHFDCLWNHLCRLVVSLSTVWLGWNNADTPVCYSTNYQFRYKWAADFSLLLDTL